MISIKGCDLNVGWQPSILNGQHSTVEERFEEFQKACRISVGTRRHRRLDVRGRSKSTFAQDSRVLTPPPPHPPRFRPCSPLFFFEHPPSKVRSFWLELPLSPSISIPVKFREKKLIMSKWSLYKVATIGAWQKWPLYRESIQNSEVFKSKHEIYYLSWLSKSRFIWRTKIRKD